MKRNPTAFLSLILIVCLALTSMSAFASSKRKVLIEEATNASCPPCAAANPTLEKFWEHNLKDVCPVTYHSSWPGADDPMYLDDITINNIRIVNYYAIQGVPQAEVNGTAVAASDTVTMRKKVDACLASTPTSPITIKITTTPNGTNVNVKVVVSTDEDIASKVLRVVVNEFHHYYGSTAGNNGETDFYYIAKKMLPNPNGTVINIAAGGSQEFTFTYQIKSTWNTGDMYVTAFVQDDGSKEVLQAESSLQLASPELSTDNEKYIRIGRNATVTKTITVKNPTDVSMAVTFGVDSALSGIPSNWKVTFSPTSATLAPGKETNVTMTVVSGPNAAYAVASMKATPKTSRINKAESTTFYFLTDDAKYAMYAGLSAFYVIPASSFLSSTKLANDAVVMPIDLNMMQVWAPSDFDLIFIPEDYFNRISGTVGYMEYSSIGTKFYSEINQMLNAGKAVLMTSELGLSDAFGQYGSSMSKSFYNNTLGVTSGGTAALRVTVNTSGQITGFAPFPVKGVGSDPDFKDVSFTGNGGTPNQDAFIIYTDLLKINSGSDAQPIIYYDNKTANIGGVKVVKGDGKLVYLTMGFEAIANATQRQGFMNKIVNWLLTPIQHNEPTFESVSVLDFDSVAVKTQKDTAITVANKGTSDLTISEIKIDLDDAGVFSLIDKPTLPLTIKPESNIIIKVRFNAKEVKDYTAVLAFSDNTTDAKHIIDLFATGKNATGVTDPSNNGTLALSAGPNPFQTETRVTLNVATDAQVDMYVLDATGKEVAKLMNEKVAAGSYTKNLSGSGLSAGAYLIIAKANGSTVQLPVVLVH